MREASSFKELKDKQEFVNLDKFIEKNIYNQFDDGIYPAEIYNNILEQDGISLKEFVVRLTELGFVSFKEKKTNGDKYIKIQLS